MEWIAIVDLVLLLTVPPASGERTAAATAEPPQKDVPTLSVPTAAEPAPAEPPVKEAAPEPPSSAAQPVPPELPPPTGKAAPPVQSSATPAPKADHPPESLVPPPDTAQPLRQSSPNDRAMNLDEISVTATREERPTLDVPQAIAVIGKDRLENATILNVKDAVAGTPGVLIDSKNGGYDARLIIRGAGLRANYGIREIMFLRDGVPLTDPDSLTRLDWVDMQDIQRIEISKGPGNLYSPGSAGGAVQIFSRSVFDAAPDGGNVSRGSYERWNLHLRSSARTERAAVALSASMRMADNTWRTWNKFDTKQVSLKQGLLLGDAGTIESEIAYTEANLQLPGAMDRDLFQVFKDTGRQDATSEPWKDSGRYSKILFVNAKLEQTLGSFLLKPRVYYSQWRHRHPVTGVINVTQDWTHVVGTDLEAQHRHERGFLRGTLVAGVTFKAQWNNDVRKYQYRDVQLANNRIVATLSDAQGDLMQQGTQQNLLGGVFLQESLQPWRWLLIDIGGRLDRTRFVLKDNEITTYNYSTGNYRPGEGEQRVSRSMWLPAPKAGVTLKLTNQLSLYASAARAYQVPTESELTYNQSLDTARSTSYEVGLKARTAHLSTDISGYLMSVKNEIVSFRENGVAVYQNAGATDKKGLEASVTLRLFFGIEAGGAYSYSDFKYDRFVEQVGQTAVDRSGNRLPYVPRHQGSLFASWRHPWGLRVRIQSDTWGRYYLDNANSESYDGYSWLTGLSAFWTRGPHAVGFEAQNLFDQRYAMEVTKDTSGRVLYGAGMPRTFMATYQLRRGP